MNDLIGRLILHPLSVLRPEEVHGGSISVPVAPAGHLSPEKQILRNRSDQVGDGRIQEGDVYSLPDTRMLTRPQRREGADDGIQGRTVVDDKRSGHRWGPV